MPSSDIPNLTDSRKSRFDKITIATGVLAYVVGSFVMMATVVEGDWVYWTANAVSYVGFMAAAFSVWHIVLRKIQKTSKA